MIAPRLAAALALCTALAAPSPSPAEVASRGVPLLFHHLGGTLEDGTEISRWQILLLWSSLEIGSPEAGGIRESGLFPFYVVRSGPGEAASWRLPRILPLVARKTDEFGALTYVFPFIRYQSASEATGSQIAGWGLIPLVWRDQRTVPTGQVNALWVFPFLRASAADSKGDVMIAVTALLPFFHQVLGAQSGPEGEEAPSRENWGVFPVTWGWSGEEFDHFNIHPLFYFSPGRRVTVFPIFWWGQRYLSIVPLWGRWEGTYTPSAMTDPEQVELHETFRYWLFPVFTHFTQSRGGEEPYRENHFLFPLFAWGDGGGRTERRAFPLFRRGTQERDGVRQESVWALTPIYWQSETARDGALVRRHRVVFPLFWDYHRVAQLPVSPEATSGRERRSHTTVAIPLFSRVSVDGMVRHLGVWPLWFGFWRPAAEAGEALPVETNVFALFVRNRRWGNGDTRFEFFGPLFRREHLGPEIHTRLLGILFATDRDPEAETARAALLWRLAEYTRQGGDRGVRLLYLPWRIPLP